MLVSGRLLRNLKRFCSFIPFLLLVHWQINEKDILLRMVLLLQSDDSDGSSAPSSPPTSVRLTPKGPNMPLLNLAGSARKGGPAALPSPLSTAPRYALAFAGSS